MIGIYITFNDTEYIGIEEDVTTVSDAQILITSEVNQNNCYHLKNTKDGDIMFPKNALFKADIKLVKLDD